MRKLTAFIILTGAVVLAVTIGQRMSTDAMAVAVGVVFGVAASIPTSLLVVFATRAANQPRDNSRYQDPPRVVIIQQPAPPQISAPAPDTWEPRRWQDDGAQVVEATWTMIGE